MTDISRFAVRGEQVERGERITENIIIGEHLITTVKLNSSGFSRCP
jgi:hypothetical protein